MIIVPKTAADGGESNQKNDHPLQTATTLFCCHK
jgi:hypothetical protein